MSAKKVRNRSERKLREAPELTRSDSWTSGQFGLVLGIGLLFCACAAIELGGVTPEGTLQFTHWTPWRHLGIIRTGVILFLPFLVIAWVLWKAEKGIAPARMPIFVGVLVFASLLLQALGIAADPRGLPLVEKIAAHPISTSYYNDAILIPQIDHWMLHFHQLNLHYHSLTHPPGPVLFYYAVCKLVGPANGALAGGWAVGMLASIGVAVMYVFAGLWTEDRKTRLTAAAFYALVPALTLFFPEFDQVYPIVCMLLVYFWVKALEIHSKFPKFAILTGVALFAGTFMAYNLLTLGVFVGLYGLWFWRREDAQATARLLRAAAAALGTWCAIYAVLWLTTGFDPVASLKRAISNQALLIGQSRAYVPFLALDMYDYFFGAGMIALPILILYLRRVIPEINPKRTDIILTVIGLITVIIVDLSGQLRGETARVWLFLQPLLAVPVAMEISRQPWRWRLSIFALQWWILVCLKAKLTFLDV